MRHIVYLLLVANVLYLGWNLSQDKAVAQKMLSFPPMPTVVHSLVMLKEIAGNTANVTDMEYHVKTDTKKGGAADMYDGKETERENATVTAQTEQPNSRQGHVCKTFEFFDYFGAAGTVSNRLVSMGMIPMLGSEDRRVVDDYWVYLPGKGREYSREVIQKLKDGKINDYYVYDSKNYLMSLGTFKNLDLAEKRMAMLQQMGLDAILEKRYKPREEHRLEMYFEGTYVEQLKNIGMQTPGLQIKTNPCTSLAAR